MRILMLAPPAHVRGPLPKHTPELVAALRALGCTVEVEGWGRHREGEPLGQKVVGRNADIRRIRRRLRAEPFDMLVVKTAHDWHTLSRDVPLLLATRGLCAHQVLQFHGCWADRLVVSGHAAFKLASSVLIRLCDAALVLSTEEQRQWQAFRPATRVYVVKNPIRAAATAPMAPSRHRFGVPDGEPLVLFVGRLLEIKGLFDLIAALPVVRARTPCHLVVVGDGPLSGALRQRIEAGGVAPHVTLAGYLDGGALRAAYAAADVFVLPSRSEGFPFAILEAMDAGLPVLTTRIRGMVDHLGDGVHGLLIPPGDPAALAEALHRLVSDPELRARMGRANREKLRDFAPDVVAGEYLAALRSIAAAPGRRAD